ncbi:MAG: response regulator [Zoogloeaceae bacterium]|jgi:serine/threonine-protein kinase|nr:response regulator [Zoogloeaceae bacterium]
MQQSAPQSVSTTPIDNMTPGGDAMPTILLLDDEVRIVDTLRLILRPYYRVLSAINGQDALRLLKDNPVQVIISDQRMPQMTGVEFLRQARAISPASVRILLTGFSDLRAIIDSVNEGEVFRFLNKPWGNAELLAVVKDAMDVARQLAAMPAASLAELARQAGMPEGAKNAVADMDKNAPTIRTTSEPSTPCTQGSVLIKTTNRTLFDQIRRAQPESIDIILAASLDETLAHLSQQRVMVLVAHFESVETAHEEALAFKLLKRDMPALLTIALVHKADANEVISLINQGRVFRLATLPCKATQVGFYIQSALRQSQTHTATPQLLETQRAVAIDAIEERRAPGLFSRIGGICRRWLGGVV